MWQMATTRGRAFMARAVRDIEMPVQEIPGTSGTTAEREKLIREPVPGPGIFSAWLIGVVLFGAALSFNLFRLGVPSIWYDEAFSVELARQPLPILWNIIFGHEPNMEFYYLFLHGWLRFTALLGLPPVEFVVRFPSALFAALGSVLVWALGRRFISMTAGIIGACLYLLNFLQLTYAQQVRGYSLQLLLLCVTWYALLRICSQSRTPTSQGRWWVCYTLAMTLAIYTHLFSLFVLLAQVVMVVGLFTLHNAWRGNVRKQWRAYSFSLLVMGLLSLPLMPVVLGGPKTGWLAIPHFSDLFMVFFMIAGYNRLYVLAILVCVALGIVSLVLSYALSGKRWGRSAYRYSGGFVGLDLISLQKCIPMAWGLFCWLVVPVIVSYLVSQGSIRLFSSRYLVVILPALFLLIALFVTMIRNRVVRTLLSIALLALTIVTVPFYYKSAQTEDWKPTAVWLQQQYREGDGLVCFDNLGGCQIAVEYYLHAYPTAAHFTSDVPGAYSWEQLGPAQPGQQADDAVDPAQLASYASKHPRLFFIVGRMHDNEAASRARDAQQWLDNHFRSVGQITTRTVTVRLYEVVKN